MNLLIQFAPRLLLGLFLLQLGNAAIAQTGPLSAADIVERVANPEDGETAVADYTLILIDRRDRQRTRTLRVYRKDYGADSKTLSLFDSPADIRGTAYLNFDWDDPETDDDSWLYLPSLQRVRRIATSDTSDSFMGSDFTYADINGLEVDWFDYRFINESVMVDGHDTWHIEATPKAEFKARAEESTGYSRIHLWVRKDNFLQLRGQYWELRGNRIKYLTASDMVQLDGIWTTRRLQIISTRNDTQEHASVLQIDNVNYNTDLSDDMFTTEYMQRGLD
ncbi:MAG: hypothetical protein RLZZ385_2185 [Pseudomonadota bacterium]|jgi:outer membrane lipoprotein-sorting protein